MYKRSARIDHYTTCKSISFLKKNRAVYFVFYFPKSIFLRCKAALIIIPQGGGQDFFGRLNFLKGKRRDGGHF